MVSWTFGALCFSSLLTVIDPIAVAPIFASMTKDASPQQRRRAAARACLTALVVLIVFATTGSYMLRLFGITIESFRIAGGLLFILLGLSMLGAVTTSTDTKADAATGDPSVVPLGVPLIGGPGAMSTVMVLVGQAQDNAEMAQLGGALFLAITITFAMLVIAPSLLRHLGATGVELTTKVMGLIVLVIGVQFITDGIRGLMATSV